MKKPFRPILIAVLAMALFHCGPLALADPPPGYKLVWSDEFNGPVGTQPDSSKWSFDDGKGYNNELEVYLGDSAHCRIVADPAATDGTALQVEATNYGPGIFNSARLNTQGKFSFEYGYIEARIKLPSGQGMWPAFWMLGNNIGTVGWPKCGEVDIMENIGREPAINHGSIHGPGYTGGPVGSIVSNPDGQPLSAAYHTYGMLWQPGKIIFSFDGKPYATDTQADLPKGSLWAFDGQPFYIILNLAIGGSWPGNPDATTQFPQDLRVDYVRVYEMPSANPTN